MNKFLLIDDDAARLPKYRQFFDYLDLEYVENKSRLLLSGCLTAIYTSIQDKLANKMTRNFELLSLSFQLCLPPKITLKSFCIIKIHSDA
jgi:hypothetical protein